jgi:hypothetical protein
MIILNDEELKIEWETEGEGSYLLNGKVGNAIIFQIESFGTKDYTLMGMMETFDGEISYKSLRSAKRGAERILIAWFKSLHTVYTENVYHIDK